MNVATGDTLASVAVEGVRVDLVERGQGRPLLFLHPGIGLDPTAPILDCLARQTRVIAPSHPGFGNSDLPGWMTTVDDLAYFYLDLMDTLDLRDVVLVGVSFGAWIAAEMAVKSTARVSHLVLANAVGIKVGDRETRDIVDVFAITEDVFNTLAYSDPAAGRRDYQAMPDVAVIAAARNRESLARFAWSPYMHNPKLKRRLRRIHVPTLLPWGTDDRILTPDYGLAYAAAIPGAQFAPIARAGHFPHLEQPEVFADQVLAFAAGPSPA
jgi:pimeloyl-ACP methyl ester carboxylesterase